MAVAWSPARLASKANSLNSVRRAMAVVISAEVAVKSLMK